MRRVTQITLSVDKLHAGQAEVKNEPGCVRPESATA
ncbi:hypothetical protein BN1044_02053 [Hafnia alvei]|mgnify:CR=1 FL=1|uniref:Uncharacterized protein n=1 Tax=Hafnia alvei TaxID=569 RepID=A0A1C6Z0R6_HAFAL|nr:hypothetical protein BN1044_02053 [Hafnia alvei]